MKRRPVVTVVALAICAFSGFAFGAVTSLFVPWADPPLARVSTTESIALSGVVDVDLGSVTIKASKVGATPTIYEFNGTVITDGIGNFGGSALPADGTWNFNAQDYNLTATSGSGGTTHQFRVEN